MDRDALNIKLKEVTAKIVKKFKPRQIILFGSWAWGNPGPDSDVDLFIVKKTNNTRHLARKIDSFIFPRPFPLDIIVYNPGKTRERKKNGDFFIRDILEKGKVLYAE